MMMESDLLRQTRILLLRHSKGPNVRASPSWSTGDEKVSLYGPEDGLCCIHFIFQSILLLSSPTIKIHWLQGHNFEVPHTKACYKVPIWEP